ncbi:MAG: hypothetical protein D6689_10425 [Deltaproteobacteria bacterium]|nr:MAG: hypothetical protein D6689_10425 [Deltaproteobacteria bacterium]
MAELRGRSLPWRAWLRAFHRDAGYLVVGLTFVYAISGLAINHVHQWNPNFVTYERIHDVGGPLPADDEAAIARVLAALHIDDAPIDAYRAAPDQIEIELDGRTLHVDTATGSVVEEGNRPRFFLRVANWLHYNRSKQAWTYVADAYAVLLLCLATSGLFMLRGRKGLIGRGAVLVAIGAAVPIAYVAWSGGP